MALDSSNIKICECAIDTEKTGEMIAKLMKDNGVKNSVLAENLSVTEQTICKWRKGHSIPSIDNLVILSVLFRMPMDEILILDKKVTDVNGEEQKLSVMKTVQNLKGIVMKEKGADPGTAAMDRCDCEKEVVFYIQKNEERRCRKK